jgi:hypothetical protein
VPLDDSNTQMSFLVNKRKKNINELRHQSNWNDSPKKKVSGIKHTVAYLGKTAFSRIFSTELYPSIYKETF